MLFATSPRDAATFVLVSSILTLVAILPCWFPALRATPIDPAVALRDESEDATQNQQRDLFTDSALTGPRPAGKDCNLKC